MSTAALASSGPVSQPVPTTPAGNGGSNASPPNGGDGTGSPAADLINSLNQLRADLVSPFAAAVNLGTGFGNALNEAGNILSDAANGKVSLVSLGGHYLFGTSVYNPGPPASSFLRGIESASDKGQLGAYVSQAAASAGSNVWHLPGRAYNAAGSAFSTFAATGDLGPLVTWAGTYGVALDGLATGAIGLAGGLVEGAAGVLRVADVGAFAAEAAGAPAWTGALAAFGASDGLINFLGEESGAADLSKIPGFSQLIAATDALAADAAAAPVVTAETSLGVAEGGAEPVAEQVALAGDTTDAATLVEGINAAAVENELAGETGDTAAEATGAVQGLGDQTAEAQGTANVDPADVAVRNLENVIDHRIGGQSVTLVGQIWHLPEGTTVADIPAADPVGDRLGELAQQAAQGWDTSDLTVNQQNAINEQVALGKQWAADLLESAYRGSWIENQVELNSAQEFPQLQWSARGVDAVDPNTDLQYDILSGSAGNISLHALRPGLTDLMFRMITFPTR